MHFRGYHRLYLNDFINFFKSGKIHSILNSILFILSIRNSRPILLECPFGGKISILFYNDFQRQIHSTKPRFSSSETF